MSHTSWMDPASAPSQVVLVAVVLVSVLSCVTRHQQQLRRWFSCRGLQRTQDVIPPYWQNAGRSLLEAMDRSSPDYFDDIYPVPLQNRSILQGFLNETSSNTEVQFNLVRAVRVEHSGLWSRYQDKAAAVASQRKVVKFQGTGAPSTNCALAHVESDGWEGGFVHALDESICEAYLFHGTDPHSALKIVENGFEVKKSRAGKRFGFGGYFSEDPAVADRYAGEGEGLYRACYALLLCRVLLGRQYRTTKFRDESVTEEAFRQRFDSVLAEPHCHLHREFVIFDGHQVYPEYALVYERLSPDFWMCPSPVRRYWADEEADTAEMGSWSLPAYWFHAREELTGAFHETHPDHQMKAVLEDLMNKTWLSDPTVGLRPGHTGHHEHATARTVGLRVLKVIRVEDSEMWRDYKAAQRRMRSRRGPPSCPPLHVHTVEALPEREHRRLHDEVNEVYLFYGSSPQRVMYLAHHGFPLETGPRPDEVLSPVRGEAEELPAASKLFGEGAYLHEDASEADKLSSDDKGGYYRGYFAMLLCRVTLGNVQMLQSPDPEAHQRVGPDQDGLLPRGFGQRG
ncbi:Tankyrase-1 [Symbiodinium microadriaticum]|uniref:Tankyrase-1 n=1 Tax=Symbiodinium microadriaticum TaxID=2951 RepID=A0A1Q9CKX8_SYMMI|nr:Tankyrase-1 [Symbiodinium microadriaticum]